jgi:hypothetical protein
MKKSIRNLTYSAAVVLLAFFPAPPVFAHGGEPRLEISADRLNPGATLEIRGVDFEYEQEIKIDLLGEQTEVPLGTVTTDVEGGFSQVIVLPTDLAEGTYTLRATAYDHVTLSPPLTVWGSADLGGGEDPTEQEDLMLAPLPTTSAIDVPTPASQSAVPEKTVPLKHTSVSVVWMAAGIAGIVLLGLLVRRRRP